MTTYIDHALLQCDEPIGQVSNELRDHHRQTCILILERCFDAKRALGSRAFRSPGEEMM
jgi:hypothetical protein